MEEADWEEAGEADSTTSGGEESELESAAGDVSLGEFAALVYRRVHVAARGGAWRRVASCVRAAIASGCGGGGTAAGGGTCAGREADSERAGSRMVRCGACVVQRACPRPIRDGFGPSGNVR